MLKYQHASVCWCVTVILHSLQYGNSFWSLMSLRAGCPEWIGVAELAQDRVGEGGKGSTWNTWLCFLGQWHVLKPSFNVCVYFKGGGLVRR